MRFLQSRSRTASRGPLRIAAAAGGLILASALVACGQSPAPVEPTSAPTTEPSTGPVAGGAISQIVSVDTSSFDPARLPNMNPTLSGSAMSLVFGQLLWSDVETGDVTPGIAESMTPNEDGTVWTLKLRPGVTFSDGTAYDATAVKANWDRFADPETAAVNGPAARSFESEVIDDVTLELRTESPNFFLDRIIASQLTFIVSPTAVDGNADVFTTDPIGAGPFVLAEAVPGSHYVYERNESYWEDGKPYLDEVTLRVIGDRQQQFDTMSTGGADLFIGNSMEAEEKLGGSDLVMPDNAIGGGRVMFFNNARAPFDDVRARTAVTLAIDADNLAFTQEPGAASGAIASLFSPNSPFFDPSLTFPTQDVDEAQRLFDELAAEGKPLEFKVVAGGAGGTRAAELLQAELSAFNNVTVHLDIIPLPNFEEQVTFRGDFDVAFRPGNMFVSSPVPGFEQLVRAGGVSNISKYESAEMEQLLDDLLAAGDLDSQRAALKKVHELYVAELPSFPYGNSSLFTAHVPAVQGLAVYGEGTALYQDLWLEQ